MLNTMPFILLSVGLLLIFLEFYTPGGILAVAGAIFVISAVVTFLNTSTSIIASLVFVVFTILSIILMIYFAINRIRSSSKENTFYLSDDQEGYQSSHFDQALIGKVGTNITDLGPSGFIVIEGRRYQATCPRGYLDKGHEVEVIGGEGAHLIVKPLK